MNIGIAWSQLCVMALNDANAIAQPFADLKYGNSFGREDRRERMPHYVRRNPLHFLSLHIIRKGTPEIVSVSGRALADIRLEREVIGLFAFQVTLEESGERSGQGNAALLAVFGAKRGGCADVQAASVEPINASLVNLATAQPGIESTKLNEFQIIACRLCDELVLLLFRAEPESSLRFVSGEFDLGNGVVESGPLNLNAPPEKASERHHVALRRGFGNAPLQRLVELSGVLPVHAAGCERMLHAGSELGERNGLRSGALLGILVHAEFVGNEPLNFVFEVLVGHDERVADDFGGFADGFAQVAGLEVDPFADAADLPGEPVRSSFQVKILHRSQRAFTESVLESTEICGKLGLQSCAVQGLNLRPLPCQGSPCHRQVHSLAFTTAFEARESRNVSVTDFGDTGRREN